VPRKFGKSIFFLVLQRLLASLSDFQEHGKEKRTRSYEKSRKKGNGGKSFGRGEKALPNTGDICLGGWGLRV